MNTYIAKFRGRQRSALGVVQLEEIVSNVYCEMLSVYDNLKHLGYTTSDKELSKNTFEKNVIKDGEIVFTGTATEVIKFLKAKHK